MIPVELRNTELRDALVKWGVPEDVTWLPDQFYALPTPGYIRGPFAKELSGILKQLRYTYMPQVRDCDDFARFAATIGGYFHAETVKTRRATEPNIESGLALGELSIVSRLHALCVAVHWDEEIRTPYVMAYEPQMTLGDGDALLLAMRPVILNPEDIQSCADCRF